MARMKRLQISLEPELDLELGISARRHGISKAELVRRVLRADLRKMPSLADDPLVSLFGTFRGGEPFDSERHDDVIYD